MQNPYLRQLLGELNDLHKRLSALERLDVNPPVSGVVSYSGTPTAGQVAFFTGAGTVAGSAQSAIDHGSIGGLTDDDHAGYVRLAGRNGGQTLKGGTGSGDDLTLLSTNHATKGNIFFGAAGGTYDEANDRWGFGIVDPTVSFEVSRPDGESAAMRFISYGTALSTGIGIYTPRGTRASPSANLSGDTLGLISFGGYDTGISNGAQIKAVAAADWGSAGDSTDNPTDLIFLTVPDGSGTLTEALRLTSSQQTIAGGLSSAGASVMAVRAGTSSNDAAVGGVLYVDSATNANGTTVETDLGSYSVPSNTLAVNNQHLEFEAWITLTNNANTKTIKFKFGATVVTLPTVSGGAATLHVRGFVVRTGAATQDIFVSQTLTGAVTTNTETFTTAAETLSGAVTMKFTGQSNSASNDVKQEFYKVTWHDANL